MANNPNIKRIPAKIMNECSFCHKKGLKPGMIKVVFPKDIRTQKHFESIAPELPLNSDGLCMKCESITKIFEK